MKNIYDVIVIGAGPAGSSSAYFLAKKGFKVLLLDKAVFPRDKTCGDALSFRALDIIERMGVLSELSQYAKEISKLKFISPDGREVKASLKNQDKRKGVMVVPRLILDEKLKNCALAAGVDFFEGYKVKDIFIDQNHANVQGIYKNQLFACKSQLVILATGANLSILDRIGILKKRPQTMLASRCYYSNVTNIDSIIFSYEGLHLPSYAWIFPLPGNKINIGAGFFKTGKNAEKMPITSKLALQNFINSPKVREILKGAKQESKIRGFPLRVDFLRSPNIGDRVMLVGEAAGLVNPLTGEGVDYALETGYIAAEEMKTIFEYGEFSTEGLKTYDKRLKNKYTKEFFSLEKARDILFSNEKMLNKLMKKANKNEKIKYSILQVALGSKNPSKLLSPIFFSKLLGN